MELRGLKTSSVCLLHIMLTSLTSVLLILLQTDSSPSMSLAQLTKVLFVSFFSVVKKMNPSLYICINLFRSTQRVVILPLTHSTLSQSCVSDR